MSTNFTHMSKNNPLSINPEELHKHLLSRLEASMKHKGPIVIPEEDKSLDIKSWVSTGSKILDIMVSNRLDGGLPLGRICYIVGDTQSGKSIICDNVLANVQKMGGIAIKIDTETSMNREFTSLAGVDMSKLIYARFFYVEEVFELIENTLTEKIKSYPEVPCVIVFDSIAGATTKEDMESGVDVKGFAMKKATIISKNLSRLTSLLHDSNVMLLMTNQYRMKMNVMPGSDPYVSPGGKAPDFFSTVKIKLTTLNKIKKEGVVVGVSVKATVVKNRVNAPHKSCNFNILYDRGLDIYGTLLDSFKSAEIVKVSGGVYNYQGNKFTSKDFPNFCLDNKDLVDKMIKEYYDKVSHKYCNPSNINSVLDTDEYEDILPDEL